MGLTPMYLQEEERIVGLVRMLSVGLRLLTLVEWVVREELRQREEKLEGVYDGQAGRKTASPSAELWLKAMREIRVVVVHMGEAYHVLLEPLNATQRRLLELWGLPLDLYDRLRQDIPRFIPALSEP